MHAQRARATNRRAVLCSFMDTHVLHLHDQRFVGAASNQHRLMRVGSEPIRTTAWIELGLGHVYMHLHELHARAGTL